MAGARSDLAALVGKAKSEVKRRLAANLQTRVRLERPLHVEPALPEPDESLEAFKAAAPSREPKPPWADSLWEFESQIKACERCPLGKTRRNFVFGEGRKDARLVFVGEAPGADEDRLGRPFVGAAGQLLTRIIQAMGFKREDVYICNVLKCRPPQNRDPEPEEVESCRPYVEHQLGLIKPKAVVALGRFATQMLLQTSTGITKLRGQWQEWKGLPVMPTFHPSALLRDERLKRQVWEDMKLVMKKLGEG